VFICAGTYHLADVLYGNDHTVLQGAGQGVTIIDGGATFSDHESQSGGVPIVNTHGTPVTINDMTLTHGATDGSGGAIYASADLIVEVPARSAPTAAMPRSATRRSPTTHRRATAAPSGVRAIR